MGHSGVGVEDEQAPAVRGAGVICLPTHADGFPK